MEAFIISVLPLGPNPPRLCEPNKPGEGTQLMGQSLPSDKWRVTVRAAPGLEERTVRATVGWVWAG